MTWEPSDEETVLSCPLPRPRTRAFSGPSIVAVLIVLLSLAILVTTGVLYFWAP